MSADTIPGLPKRNPDSHKGDYGRALLIGGSVGMTGAISLAGMAALRSGAGLVTIAAPSFCVPIIATHEPSYMTAPVKTSTDGTIALEAKSALLERCQTANCVALGPGLGQDDDLSELVGQLYAEVPTTMVLDADGLNALARHDKIPAAQAARILTPHPGEFRRLLRDDSLSVDALAKRAPQFAATHGCVLVLKGHRTLITDGTETAVNATGNPGMATGGTGDVLTGVICALVAQGLSTWEAARLGVHLHGLAGDLAAAELGQHGLIASDVVRFLPAAFQQHAASG